MRGNSTCLKAIQKLPTASFREAAGCRAWLYRIMVNTYRDWYRRRQKSPEVPVWQDQGKRVRLE